jgi:transposase
VAAAFWKFRLSEPDSSELSSYIIAIGDTPRLSENPKSPPAKRPKPDSTVRMIRPGFLDSESRQDLTELARDGSAAHRLARRANALVLLDEGMSCAAIAKVLLLDDDTIRTADAVHPTHAVRPVGCWAPKDTPIAVAQTSGRQRLNIYGAIDLETGNTRILDVPTVDADSTIKLLIALQQLYPRKRVIHLFLDNARYHHAKLVQVWLVQLGCRIKLHFIPAYCPYLASIERLWGLMHKQITHNRCRAVQRSIPLTEEVESARQPLG